MANVGGNACSTNHTCCRMQSSRRRSEATGALIPACFKLMLCWLMTACRYLRSSERSWNRGKSTFWMMWLAVSTRRLPSDRPVLQCLTLTDLDACNANKESLLQISSVDHVGYTIDASIEEVHQLKDGTVMRVVLQA